MASPLPTTVTLPPSHPFHQLNDRLVQQKIQQVRTVLEEHFDSVHPELYNQKDIDIVCGNDWQIYRFLLRQGNQVDAAIEMIKQTFLWRKSYRISEMKDSDFPDLFYRLGSVFVRPRDKQHNSVMFMRVRQHRKISGMENLSLNYVLHTVNKMDIVTEGKGIAVVFDCQGSGMVNIDLGFVWRMVQVLLNYYPYGISYALVVDMPWIFESCWSIIKGWMPEEFRRLIRFVNREQVLDYVDRENVPCYLGGSCPVNCYSVPEDILTLEQMTQKGLLDRQVSRSINKLLKPYLDLANEESKQFYQEQL